MIWIDDAEALDPALRCERDELRTQIEELLPERCGENPHWRAPPLGVNFDARLFRKIRRAGLHGPLWQQVRGARASASRPRLTR